MRREPRWQTQEAIGGENDPLAIALSIAADTKQPVEIRLGACGLAIPVMYPKLSATTVQANHTVTRMARWGRTTGGPRLEAHDRGHARYCC